MPYAHPETLGAPPGSLSIFAISSFVSSRSTSTPRQQAGVSGGTGAHGERSPRTHGDHGATCGLFLKLLSVVPVSPCLSFSVASP